MSSQEKKRSGQPTHVHPTIETHQRYRDGDDADHEGEPLGRPSAVVFEDGKDVAGGTTRREHPQRDDDGKDTDDVEDQDQRFHQRKLLGQRGVEDDGKDGDGDDEHGAMPTLRLIRVRVVQDDQALDDGAVEKGDAHNRGLPSH